MRTQSHTAAVEFGISKTARVVTGAAAIMVAVFVAFALSSFSLIQQLGIGLATAVLIDATIVRLGLLPSIMKLAGDRTWWLPTWLDEKLPLLDTEGAIFAARRRPPARDRRLAPGRPGDLGAACGTLRPRAPSPVRRSAFAVPRTARPVASGRGRAYGRHERDGARGAGQRRRAVDREHRWGRVHGAELMGWLKHLRTLPPWRQAVYWLASIAALALVVWDILDQDAQYTSIVVMALVVIATVALWAPGARSGQGP